MDGGGEEFTALPGVALCCDSSMDVLSCVANDYTSLASQQECIMECFSFLVISSAASDVLYDAIHERVLI